jgi:hypothetical protein
VEGEDWEKVIEVNGKNKQELLVIKAFFIIARKNQVNVFMI